MADFFIWSVAGEAALGFEPGTFERAYERNRSGAHELALEASVIVPYVRQLSPRMWRLAHLSHSEGHCYRTRVDRFVSEELPEFEPDDAQMYLELYRNANAEDAFDHFEEQRETNVEYLRTLPRSAGERRAMHQEAGEITLQQMLHEWTMHDLGHIRQIAELVRARKHLQAAGKLGDSYHLKP